LNRINNQLEKTISQKYSDLIRILPQKHRRTVLLTHNCPRALVHPLMIVPHESK
jgi:hypothetical protein